MRGVEEQEEEVISQILIPLLIALVLGLTLPGTNMASEILGPGVVKVAGVALLLLVHRRIILLFNRPEYVRFLLLLFIYLFYRTVHATVLDIHWVLPWVSFIWFIIIASGLSHRRRIYHFTVALVVPLQILILSPGVERVLNLSRGIAHDDSRESLTGLAVSYNIYSMSALAGYFLALTAFLMTRNFYLRILFGAGTVVAFIGTITAGSRGGMITIVVGTSIYLMLFHRIRKRQRPYLVIAVYLIVILIVIILPWDKVFDAVTSQDISTGSTALRWFLMKTSFYMALDKPFIGWGWEAVRVRVMNTTHCGWLQIWAELGLVGLALEVLMWGMVFKCSLRTHREAVRNGMSEVVLLNLGYSGLLISYGLWQFVQNISFAHGTRLHYMVAGALLALYFSVVPARSRSSARAPSTVPPLPVRGVARGTVIRGGRSFH